MKVNINLDVSDARRNMLAIAMAGKPTKRLASRDDVWSFVEGILSSLDPLHSAPTAEPNEVVIRLPTTREARGMDVIVTKLKAEGRDEAYIASYTRGWLAAGRTL